MWLLRSQNQTRTMARWSLAASLFLAPVTCTRIEAGEQSSPAPNHERPAQELAAATAPTPLPAAGAKPLQAGQDGLDAFAQALAHTLDPSRISTRPALPEGGTLHIPNGYAAHAAILVRQPDGTLRTTCVSSAAEVSALVKQMRNGADQ